ncbi:protein of unknown function (plasmid) [Cupriavidus taiwanensis]|uniref:Uncharacterized protein n=1 Tax=Cupriavidus taiwanensis TaxID=164546 RepID=A0A375IUE2_9BURK|nr:protein of unknown function [Cupriavidus taiwanensis]
MLDLDGYLMRSGPQPTRENGCDTDPTGSPDRVTLGISLDKDSCLELGSLMGVVRSAMLTGDPIDDRKAEPGCGKSTQTVGGGRMLRDKDEGDHPGPRWRSKQLQSLAAVAASGLQCQFAGCRALPVVPPPN